MAELVDAQDLGSCGFGRGGSIPPVRTFSEVSGMLAAVGQTYCRLAYRGVGAFSSPRRASSESLVFTTSRAQIPSGGFHRDAPMPWLLFHS